jgi:hypothetical protein
LAYRKIVAQRKRGENATTHWFQQTWRRIEKNHPKPTCHIATQDRTDKTLSEPMHIERIRFALGEESVGNVPGTPRQKTPVMLLLGFWLCRFIKRSKIWKLGVAKVVDKVR